jgi:uncharacterized protein (DUF58 family)
MPSGPPDLKKFLQELEYAIQFNIRNLYPGKWRSRGGSGAGRSFEKFESLSSHPDFRRIDMMATGRNPLAKEPLVRLFKPTARTDVIMVADLSLSISCGLQESKIAQIAKLATLFGYTAFRLGDRFGFIGFDNKPLEEFYFPPSRSRTIGLEIGEDVLTFRPSAPLRRSFLNLSRHLPETKSFVLLVSDFYFERGALMRILDSLSRHSILPIVLRQERERRWPPGLFGILPLKDSERELHRPVFFSRTMIRRFEKQSRENEGEIRKFFRTHGEEPIVVEEVDPDRLLEELIRRWA